MFVRRLLWVGVLLVTVLACGHLGGDDTRDREFIDGLLQRRLFTLAEAYCAGELAAGSLGVKRRATLTAELVRTHAEAAVQLAPDQRADRWRLAHQVAADFLATHAGEDFAAVVQRQDAWVHMIRGQLARYESETAVAPERLRATAGEQLRRATVAFEQLEQQLEQRMVAANRQPGDRSGTMKSSQLRILHRDVQRQLAGCLLNRALCFAAGTPDRTSALTRATARFEELALLTDPVDWPSRIGQLECYRLAQRDEAFQRTWKKYLAEAPSAVAASLQLQLAHWHLAQDDFQAAWQLLEQHPATPAALAAEWDFVLLQALLAGWRGEGEGPAADAWAQRVTRHMQRIQANHGPFWLRRAEALLGRHIATSATVDQFALLIRAAEAFYRAGQIDAALDAYDRAQQAAVQTSSDEQAFQAALAAAAIVHQRKMHSAARQRFATLSLQFPNHPRAAEAHWLAVYNQAQQLKEGMAADGPEYAQLLAEHIRRWPQGDTAGKARWWLGQFHAAQRQWDKAMDAYQDIPSHDPRFADAVAAIARCYQGWLGQRADIDPVAQRRLALEGIRFFDQIHGSDKGTASAGASLAAVEAARLRLYGLGAEFAEAARQLRRALDQTQSPPPAWLPRARLYLVYALAAQGEQWEEAHQLLEQVEGVTAEDLHEFVDALARLLDQRRTAGRKEIAELQLKVLDIQSVRAARQEGGRSKSLAMARAAALAAADRREAAQKAYEELVERYADDGLLQEKYAQLLLHGRQQADWQAALLRWRQVQRHSPPGSPRWFRAKYSQALAHQRLGNTPQAIRIIQLTEVLHPQLGGPQMKTRFAELLQRCQQAPSADTSR